MLMAYEAQTERCLANPVREVPEADVGRTEQQREEDKARWANQLTMHAGCMAVTQATREAWATLRDQFKRGGCYKHGTFAVLKEVLMVDVRKSREEATEEGWEEHWKGNSAADEVAKLVRPKLQRKGKEQFKVISNIRVKKKTIVIQDT